MADEFFTKDKFRRPELLLNEFLRKGVQGLFKEKSEGTSFLYRAIVVAVDTEGGKLENLEGSGQITSIIDGEKLKLDARIGPNNPANSIKARLISDGADKFVNDDDLRVYWPFFPETISIPIKPGEYVYVIFEDESQIHGLWVTKVPGHEGVNFAEGKQFFKPQNSNPLAENFSDTKGLANKNQKKFDKDEDAAEGKSSGRLAGKHGL